jgi:hypothetical protein
MQSFREEKEREKNFDTLCNCNTRRHNRLSFASELSAASQKESIPPSYWFLFLLCFLSWKNGRRTMCMA